MGLGREVADAYIEVHGDLSDFRKDLEKAHGDMEKLAKKNAKTFDDMLDRMKADDFKKKWHDTVQAMAFGDQIDLNKLVRSFDSKDLDEAEGKIKDFLIDLSRRHKLTGDAYTATKKALLDTVEAMRLEEDQARALEAVQSDLADMQERHNKALEERAGIMAEAIADNEKFNRSFEGIQKNETIKRLNDDFEKLAKIVNEADWDKFAKGFKSYDDMEDRVKAVTAAMREQNRISEQNAVDLNARTREYIADMRERIRLIDEEKAAQLRAKGEALDAARALREEQDRYNKSLDGMVNAAHFKHIESDFQDLTNAIGTGDWSKLAKGKTDMDGFRDSVTHTADELRRVGRISDDEYTRIIANIQTANVHLSETRTKIREADSDGKGFSETFSGLVSKASALRGHMSGTVGHFKGLAGLNIFGDMLDEGIQIASNIDRVAVSISQATLKIGSVASILGAAGGGLVNVVGDLSSMAAIGWLAPGFLVGAGIQVGVLVAAFKDMKTRLKDLAPEFQALQDQISNGFWDIAEQPIRNLIKATLPALREQLVNTGQAWGTVFEAMGKALQKHITPKYLDRVFDRMNQAIANTSNAMEPLISTFATLGDFASTYFRRFSDWIVRLSTDLDSFVTKAARDGRLKKWTDDAIEAFKDAGRAIGGVVEIFQGLNQAAEAAGLGGLKAMADSLERMADITKSKDFKAGLTPWLEGAKGATDAIMEAIDQRLFPALGNIAPTMSDALTTIGQTVGTLIGYASDLIENPAVQAGITALTTGLQTAVDTLQPAIKPLGDSLGSLLDIMGHIIQNVSTLVTAFTVTLGPKIDDIGRKFETMADPLTSTVKGAIEALGPVLDSVNTSFVGPLVNAINTGLLPAVDSFVKNAAPFLQKVAETVGPPLAALVGQTLPNVLKFAEQLFKPLGALFDLFTPALKTIVEGIGTTFSGMGDSLRDFNTQAQPTYDSLEKIRKKMEEVSKVKLPTGNNPVADLVTKYTISAVLADPAVASFALFFGKLTKGWTESLSGFIKSLGSVDPSKVGLEVGKWITGVIAWFKGGGVQRLNDTVNKWFDDTVFKPIRDGWDDAMEGIQNWWKDVKQNFQNFMSDMLGFNTSPGPDAEVHVGGGAGSRGVGGKITPEMLGMGVPDSNWLDDTFAQVSQGIAGFFSNIAGGFASFTAPFTEGWNSFWSGLGTNIGEIWTNITTTLSTWWTTISTNLTTWLAGLGEGWNGFWGGFGTTIGEIWSGITTTLSTWWTTITTNITTWLTGLVTNWNTFWGQLPVTIQNIWNQITSWISTQIGAITSRITGFATQVTTNWNNFWGGVWTKVQQIWSQVTSWISTQVGAIQSRISGFASQVTGNWNSFWGGVWSKVQSIWSQITGWISSQTGAIFGKIAGFGGQVISNWNSTWTSVQSFLQGAWQNIVTAVSGGVTNVMSFISSLPGRIAGALGGLGGLLLGAGASIMNGFLQGLQSAWGAVQNFVGGIAAWIAENKGPIAYDRMLLIPAGRAIMTGLREGLTDGMAPLKSTLESITETITNSVVEGASLSKMYAAGADAALGFANGLASNSSSISDVFDTILPNLSGSVTVGGVGGSTPETAAGATTIINVAEGAIPITTPTQDPELVASKVIDGFAGFSNL